MKITFDQTKWKQSPCVFVNTLQIFITNVCNRRCKGCFNDDRLGKGHMSLEVYKQTIQEYKPYVKKVILMGGEPTMHPNILDMIKINQANGLRTTIYTNGSFIHKFEQISLKDVTIRVGVMGLLRSEKKLIDVLTSVPVEITYMLRKDNLYELYPTIRYAEKYFNCKKIMLSSVRNITDSGDYWIDGDGDLSHDEYFNIAQDFVNVYNGNLDEIQISVRGNMSVEGGESNKCRFINVFTNGDKIICPFDICKNLTENKNMIFPDRECNKNHKCLLQKVILKRSP